MPGKQREVSAPSLGTDGFLDNIDRFGVGQAHVNGGPRRTCDTSTCRPCKE